MATADHVLQAQKGIKESFDTGARNMVEKYINTPAFNVQSNDEWASIFTTTEGFSGAKELSEHENPPVNALGDGYSVTIEKKRFGVAYEITEDDMQKMGDDTTKVDVYLTRQRNKALKNVKKLFSDELHKFYNFAFDTTYYAAPDAKALIADDHTWNSGLTFDNKSTAAFSQTALDAAMEIGSQINDGSGDEMEIDYDTIVVRKHSEAHREAIRIFAENITPTAVGDINIYEGSMKIVATPYISYAKRNYWFLIDTKLADGAEHPLYAGVGKMPAFTEPHAQENEAIRQNVTGYWMQGIINMPFAIFGSDGTV